VKVTDEDNARGISNEVAHPRGFEPLTDRLESGCSIQLSYGCIALKSQ
jgi:hypothetical protein